ncbi:MAG TPA: spherulation-specific family 4 protein, partial [Chloroflexota bacterium]
MLVSIPRRPAYSVLSRLLALALLAGLFGFGARPALAAGLTVSVTQYGAVGDGTTDNTIAFRNALGQFTSSGGTLTIPAGTYMLQPTQITIHDNITVAGSQAIIKADVVGYSLFDISGANITLTGLTIDGNNQAVQGTEVASGSSNVLLSQDTYQNFTQAAATGSQFYGSLPVGIRIDSNANSITIDGATVQNVVAMNPDGTGPNPVARGIWIEGANGVTSKNVTIENSTFGKVTPRDDGDCIVIQDATAYANLQVLHNTFNGCAKRAIKIQVPGAVIANNTIVNPFLNNNAYTPYVPTVPPTGTFDMYSAISVYASNVAVFGNTITGVGSYYNAIELGSGTPLSNVSIQGNNVQMGSGAGANLGTPSSFLRAFSALDELTVTNNTFSTGNTANTVPFGIRLDAAVTRPTIKNNTISNVTTSIQCASACQAPYAPSLAVPAYFSPGAPWTQLDQAAPTAGLAVINPNNGPGASLNTAYANQVTASQSAGIAVLGYVYTRYANSQTDTVTNGGYDRTITNVEADIDNYLAWYHVDGIFLDEATNTCDAASLNYYTTLVTYIKEKGGKGLVALN